MPQIGPRRYPGATRSTKMRSRYLTKLAISKIVLPKAGRDEYWDSKVSGLALRVSATGAMSWVIVYRVHGRQVRKTLGKFRDVQNPGDARRLASAALEKARNAHRIDAPVADKQSFGMVADRFLNEYVAQCRPATIRAWKQVINVELKPKWSDRPIADIQKSDVLMLLNAKAMVRPRQSDEIRKVLRRLYHWACDENIVDVDATAGVAKRARHPARDRVLADAEIKRFWNACDQLVWPFEPIYKLLLLTGQRRGEVGGMMWCEIDLDAHMWTIPGARTKTALCSSFAWSHGRLKILRISLRWQRCFCPSQRVE
jgi:hypothetical protein